MKYLCLVYGEEQKISEMDDRKCLAWDADRALDRALAHGPGACSVSFSAFIAGAVMIERAMPIALTVSSASTGADRKLKVIAGGLCGSADVMWIEPLLSGRIGWA